MKRCDFLKCELGCGMLVHCGLMQFHQRARNNQSSYLWLFKTIYKKCVMKKEQWTQVYLVVSGGKRMVFRSIKCLKKKKKTRHWVVRYVTALCPGWNPRIIVWEEKWQIIVTKHYWDTHAFGWKKTMRIKRLQWIESAINCLSKVKSYRIKA